ncbi:MAG: SLBB domain-containing protein [Candidatus Omnitrophica bacterium]|nr:SLBB domain-containing protein [Candidatus Omnitrophota bacterium]
MKNTVMSMGILVFVLSSAALSAAQQESEFDADSIQAGDKLNIQVYQEKDLSGSFTVSPEGKIHYPFLGEVYAEGLRLGELKDFLTENLGKEYLVNPQIQIIFEESPNKSVAILGQVSRPGNYILTPNLTLVRLISQVGGFASDAATSDVKIVRTTKTGEKSYLRADLDGYMKGKGEDLKLMPGDVIYVNRIPPEEKKEILEDTVSILGQIAKPGNYRFRKGMTLIKLISEAGGFTPLAAPNRVKLVRKAKGGKKQAMMLDARRIMDGGADDVSLQTNDLVVVAESFF